MAKRRRDPARGGHLPPSTSGAVAAPSPALPSLRRAGPLAAVVLAGAAVVGALLLGQTRAPLGRPAFDGARSFRDLEKQVAFGPRVPGMDGHAACRDWMVETLRPLADSVERQDFTRRLDGKPKAMSNVIARWKPSAATAAGSTPRGVLLCAHWDTRPTADYEREPAKRRTPIPGANDGASGVAVLVEMARSFKQAPPPVPVMMVFFDGEDFGPGLDRMFLGSRYFAANMPNDTPRRGVLIDMIGDKELTIPYEANSVARAKEVVDEVYATAAKLGYQSKFPPYSFGAIEDDHIPLLDRGLKVIDLIDFSYGPSHSWWHTLADTPDKCSADSLKAVGEVLLEWTFRQK
jgi:glutaminyl-peptide cyclotransferase